MYRIVSREVRPIDPTYPLSSESYGQYEVLAMSFEIIQRKTQKTLKRQLLRTFPIPKVLSPLLLLNILTQHKRFAVPNLRKYIINVTLNNPVSCIVGEEVNINAKSCC